MAQGEFNFDDAPEPEPEPPGPEEPRKLSIDERFAAALEHQTDLYPQFKAVAYQLMNAGQRRYSSKAIVEICRYHRAIEGRDLDGWKINNIFTSRLSRKLIEECPEFDGWFELRQLKSESGD